MNVDDTDYQYEQYMEQQQEMESKKNVTDYQSITEIPATHIKEFKGKNKLPF
jgi:hypothetical protein